LQLPSSVYQTISSNPSLSSFYSVLQLSQLSNIFEQTSSMTAFIPSNDAFNKMNPNLFTYLSTTAGQSDLNIVVKYHAIGALYYSSNFPTQSTNIATMEGSFVTVTMDSFSGQINVNDAVVIDKNVIASNGVAHVTDQVLLPSDFSFTLLKLLVGLGNTEFVNAIQTAGLSSIFSGSTKYAVIAPTDEALKAIPDWQDLSSNPQWLANFIKYHVLSSDVASSSFVNMGVLSTIYNVDGMTQVIDVTVNSNGISFQHQTVPLVLANQYADNGIVHVVSKALTVPSYISSTVSKMDDFSILTQAINTASLSEVLTQPGLTLFAPSNKGFSQLPAGFLDYLLIGRGEALNELIQVLQYHVLLAAKYGVDFPSSETKWATALGQGVTVQQSNGNIYVNSNEISLVNMVTSNGVIQTIENVLIPSSITITSSKILQGLKANVFINGLEQTGLSNIASGSDIYTIFAPSDEAFNDLSASMLANSNTMAGIMNVHIVKGSINLTPGEYVTLDPEIFIVIASDGTVSLKGLEGSATIVSVSQTSNGAVVSLNAVLLPPQGLSSGAVIGISIGVLAAILVAIGFVFYARRNRQQKVADGSEPLLNSA